MNNDKIVEVSKKVIMVLLYLSGSMLISFNLLAFTADRHGLYYKDENQWWFATGLTILMLIWIIKNWKKI
ncbi:MAG: hypothetical protein KAT04_04940 [Methylococcales bacterium]|nr:hypothetical protein [Methylococcales bacterium]